MKNGGRVCRVRQRDLGRKERYGERKIYREAEE